MIAYLNRDITGKDTFVLSVVGNTKLDLNSLYILLRRGPSMLSRLLTGQNNDGDDGGDDENHHNNEDKKRKRSKDH